MHTFDRPDVVRLFVFSHPNHELGVYGLLQRAESHLLILSDGGGAQRVEDSRRALARIGIAERATFLDRPETIFYDALLRRDRQVFDDYVDVVRRTLVRVQPDEIYCDAVERYNPGHDMTLPIVQAALDACEGARLFEVPLIHRTADGAPRYRVQQVPPSRADARLVVELTPEESRSKTSARDEVYRELSAQLDHDLIAAREGQLTREEFMEVRSPFDIPPDVALRYEERGARLVARGEADEVLTRDGHWAPMVVALQEGAGAATRA